MAFDIAARLRVDGAGQAAGEVGKLERSLGGLSSKAGVAGVSTADLTSRLAKLAGAYLSFQALGNVIGGAFDLAKAAGDLQDLAEMTGLSGAALASYKTAADVTGISIEQIAKASVRLSSGLSKIDDESKGAGKALEAIGINVQQFKQSSPDEQFKKIAAQLAGFKDGAGKTAVAVALLGKSGAEMLPFFKEYGQEAEHSSILTEELRLRADALSDTQARSKSVLQQYLQVMAIEAMPVVTAFTESLVDVAKEMLGVDKQTGQLTGGSELRDWATAGAKALAFLIDGADGVVRAFRVAGKYIGGSVAVLAAQFSGDLKLAKQIEQEAYSDIEAVLSRETFSAKLERSIQRVNDAAGAARLNQARLNEDPGLRRFAADGRTINFRNTEEGANTAKAAVDKLQAALTGIDKELMLFGKDDAFKKAFELEGLGAKGKVLDEYRGKLALLDQQRNSMAIDNSNQALQIEAATMSLGADAAALYKLSLEGATDEQLAFTKALQASIGAQKDATAAQADIRAEVEKNLEPLQQYYRELERLDRLRSNGLTDEQFGTSAQRAWDDYRKGIDGAKEATVELGEFGVQAARNIQSAFGDYLVSAMEGNYRDIGKGFGDLVKRMLSEAVAANLSKALFGDFGTSGGGGGGGLGGLLGDLIGSFSGGGAGTGATGDFARMDRANFAGGFATGGHIPAGMWGMVGEDGPERAYGGRTGLTVRPNAGGAGPTTVINKVEVINNNTGQSSVRTESTPTGLRVIVDAVRQQLGSEIARGKGLAAPIGQRFGLNGAAGLSR